MSPHYPPVGKCIYCGATRYSTDDDRPLADEHIIPFALNGTIILPEASCRQCERITGQFEQVALRGILRGARIIFDYPSRKGHPEHLPLYAHADGKVHRIDVPTEDYPAIVHTIAPAWFVPALTDYDLDPKGQWFVWGGPINKAGTELMPGMRGDQDRPSRVEMTDLSPERFYHREGITPPALHVPSFFKMIAKMAHAFAVAAFGVEAFKPYLTDIIRGGADDDMGLYIGGPRDQHLIPPIENAAQYVRFYFEHFFDGTTIIVAEVRLFAILGGPPIFIAVGELNLYRVEPSRLRFVLEEPLSRTFGRNPSPGPLERPTGAHPPDQDVPS
jgi:hypothetical protein